MRKPIAILTSDVHYSLSTLALADTAFRMAIDKAAELGVELIDCGDLTNDKAIIRAEVANKLIDTMKYAQDKAVRVTCLVGNHSLINERGRDHALEFLKPYCDIIQSTVEGAIYRGEDCTDVCYISYQSDPEQFATILSGIPKGALIIMHQGVSGSLSGEYVHDKSAIHKDLLKDHRVISGHYHTRQSIKCGPARKGAVGLMSYVGNPYTLTFAEANDPVKGFQILYNDGTMEHVPTNLRKHVVIDCVWREGTLFRQSSPRSNGHGEPAIEVNPGDLVWVKISGTSLDFTNLTKEAIRDALNLYDAGFKLDKIPTDRPAPKIVTKDKTSNEIMDMLIDQSTEAPKSKADLKNLYREIMS